MAHSPIMSRLRRAAGACLLAALATSCLNGCAALAVSLAGAGAGAGIAHQVNGVAVRTFTEPLDRMGNAVLLATRRMALSIDNVEARGSLHTTRGRIGELEVTVEMQALSASVTRVDVTARQNLFRVDAATAQEIIVQIERALSSPRLADARLAPTPAEPALETTRALKGRSKAKAPSAI